MSLSFFWYPMKRRRPVLLNTGLHAGSRPNAGALRVRCAFGQTVLLTHVRRLCPSFPHLEQGILSVFVSLYLSACHTPKKCTSILQKLKRNARSHPSQANHAASVHPPLPLPQTRKQNASMSTCLLKRLSMHVRNALWKVESHAAHLSKSHPRAPL